MGKGLDSFFDWSEELCHSLLEYDDTLGNAGFARFVFEALERLVHGFVGETERSVVHRNEPA